MVKSADVAGPNYRKENLTNELQKEYIDSMIAPSFQKSYLEFTDMDTIESRLKEQDRILRNALSSAEHANRAKTAFLNNMSHDIRTPMNAIIGFTSLAAEHLDDREIIRDYLEKISTSGKHLLSLINDVLDMSRIESGSVKIEKTNVHLPDVLEDLKTIILESVHAKQQKLLIKMQDVVHEDIITDKLRLK